MYKLEKVEIDKTFNLTKTLECGQSFHFEKIDSKKYIVYYLDKSYSNCSYHFKERDAKTVEVVITNFESEDYVQCQQISLF